MKRDVSTLRGTSVGMWFFHRYQIFSCSCSFPQWQWMQQNHHHTLWWLLIQTIHTLLWFLWKEGSDHLTKSVESLDMIRWMLKRTKNFMINVNLSLQVGKRILKIFKSELKEKWTSKTLKVYTWPTQRTKNTHGSYVGGDMGGWGLEWGESNALFFPGSRWPDPHTLPFRLCYWLPVSVGITGRLGLGLSPPWKRQKYRILAETCDRRKS